MKASFFLARKYLKPRRNAVSVITLISILGVTLGVAVLIIVLAVMTGFTDLMKDKLLQTQAHIHIRSYRGVISNPDSIIDVAAKANVHASAVIQAPVLAQIGKSLDSRLFAFGADISELKRQLGDETLLAGSADLKYGEIIISSDMQNRWNVRLGSKILLHSPNRLTELIRWKDDGTVEMNPDSPVYLPTEFTVAGIYSFGKYDFDRSVLFINREDAAELFGMPWGSASIVYGWAKDPFKMDRELFDLADNLSSEYNISTWEEENRDLLGVLQVEKRMMSFLLVFIVLVAAFSIANTLITSVYQKTREIGILKALGAGRGMIMAIFVWQGTLVGILGSFCGTVLGSLIIYLRNDILQLVSKVTGQELFPKEFYYFNELPANIIVSDVVAIVCCSILLCTLGALIPALCAAKLDPAKALRYE